MKIPEEILSNQDELSRFDEIAGVYEFESRNDKEESERLAILDYYHEQRKNKDLK